MPGRRGLWPVLVVVLLAHAAALTFVATAPAPPQGRAGVQPLRTLYVRAVQPQPGAPPEPAAPAAPEAAAQPGAPPAVAAAIPAPAETRALPRVERPSGSGAEPTPDPQAAASAAGAEAPYHPRGELTVPPRLLSSVNVAFPEEVKGIVALKVRIALFIDEQGAVQRIRIDTPDIHPSFERAVREAFADARFTPGQLEATAVRSQIRLEVEFSAANRAAAR